MRIFYLFWSVLQNSCEYNMSKRNIYLTESISGLMCGERIEANDWQEAESKCPNGYKVIGKFIFEINAPEFDSINLN